MGTAHPIRPALLADGFKAFGIIEKVLERFHPSSIGPRTRLDNSCSRRLRVFAMLTFQLPGTHIEPTFLRQPMLQEEDPP
jgi:hypothetical protein